ncbi:MAG TPA: tetratricopeptide repeat protein [Candidatus Accumulibacter phosphatis]|nr:MAG: type IV pilus biogenesis/stability protein PilW [Candidatus Accumulibacter sp. SK-11]HCV13734.1 tetratricopeptide repeat protein [Accumulibacter sp.]HRL75274.1 tetratricopeptide repeat protein [Candidatus Accumulibacter phosphatis]HRQ94061.1 tetratricopeptide repeat protein [Candidatus Accumulibacter phosphatis]
MNITLAVGRFLALLAFLSFGPLAAANTPEDLIRPIQEQWAEIKYRQPEKQQAESYHALAVQAHRIVEANPRMPEVLIWEGIVLSSEAGAKGGLGALSLAKEARQRLDEALKLNDKALNGSAYTSLATLYAKVPGWPVGFGDKERAEEYFRKALAINPDGIDPNFFYGEYLADRGRPAEALPYLEKALKAPPRPGRELADSGRRQEIQALLAKLKKENR